MCQCVVFLTWSNPKQKRNMMTMVFWRQSPHKKLIPRAHWGTIFLLCGFAWNWTFNSEQRNMRGTVSRFFVFISPLEAKFRMYYIYYTSCILVEDCQMPRKLSSCIFHWIHSFVKGYAQKSLFHKLGLFLPSSAVCVWIWRDRATYPKNLIPKGRMSSRLCL